MRLIDADALIAETMKNRCADCDRRKGIKQGKITFLYDFGDAPCRACDVGDMIDMLDEATTIGDWVSVKDRLPENRKNVLICLYDNRRRKASNYPGGKRITIRIDKIISEYGEPFWAKGNTPSVIAWMPLPEPPKEAE